MRTASALLKLALGLGNVIIAVLSINNEALKHWSAAGRHDGASYPLSPSFGKVRGASGPEAPA